MRRRFLPVAVVLPLAWATLAASGCDGQARQTNDALITVSAAADATPDGRGAKVYEGRIKDVRAAWDLLIVTVGKEKEARDMRFNIGEARIVGLSGSEWKADDLRVGDRVLVQMAARGWLVQQVRVLPDRASGIE